VIAQDLRQLDGQARDAQVATLELLEADATLIAEIPDAEYTTASGGQLRSGSGGSGQVILF